MSISKLPLKTKHKKYNLYPLKNLEIKNYMVNVSPKKNLPADNIKHDGSTTCPSVFMKTDKSDQQVQKYIWRDKTRRDVKERKKTISFWFVLVRIGFAPLT